MSQSTGVEIKPEVMGHPSQLFVIFFTEMWERFSYYGMRALLIMFLTASIMDGGWGWPREHAFAIFGTYVSLVYLATVVGGWLADNKIGYRYAILIGALLMTLGHGCMAFETQFFVYLGLTLLVVGSGFFKPNMTAIISELYKDHPEKKDGAYTIFYMGVNAGAFLGILLCGYLGEKIGWSLGFGLAGIFMLFGLLQFWFAKDIFFQNIRRIYQYVRISGQCVWKCCWCRPHDFNCLIIVYFNSSSSCTQIWKNYEGQNDSCNVFLFCDYILLGYF